MRRRAALGGLLLALGAVLAWWCWPAAPEPEVVDARPEPPPKRVVSRFTNAEPPVRDDEDGLFAEAASGELGEEMQERVCELCKVGMLDADACQLCEPDRIHGGILVVDVVDEQGRPAERARIWIQDCEFEPHGWREFIVKSGTCKVSAGRRDGALWAQAEPTEVDVPHGEESYVQLELQSARTGGLGVSIGPDAEGVRVVAVMPGTPAAEMGLEPGDLIVEVDGIDTTQIDLREFVRTMTGPEDTEVDFVVRYETEEGVEEEAITILRRYLEPAG
ncbi:MAG: PDZ domain-containing protein [Myxococcota bacterium]